MFLFGGHTEQYSALIPYFVIRIITVGQTKDDLGVEVLELAARKYSTYSSISPVPPKCPINLACQKVSSEIILVNFHYLSIDAVLNSLEQFASVTIDQCFPPCSNLLYFFLSIRLFNIAKIICFSLSNDSFHRCL